MHQYKTYKIDLDNQRIVGTIDDREALMQFIKKTLATDKYTYEYYDQNFGNELKNLVGKSKGYIMAQFPKLIKEALLVDERIIDVTDFTYEDYDRDCVLISYWITTIYSREYYEQFVNY